MDYNDYYLTITKDSKFVANYNGELIEGNFLLSNEERSFIKYATADFENLNYLKDKKRHLVEEVGTKLADVIFTSEIKKDFYQRKQEAEIQKKGLTIRLKVEVPDLLIILRNLFF